MLETLADRFSTSPRSPVLRSPADHGLDCLVACQPGSPRALLEPRLAALGLPAGRMAELDRLIRVRTGFGLDEMSPVGAAGRVRVPMFVYQVHDGVMTRPSDVQADFDAIPGDVPKELSWIHGTTRRWDGYRHFQQESGPILDWLARPSR